MNINKIEKQLMKKAILNEKAIEKDRIEQEKYLKEKRKQWRGEKKQKH